MEKLAWIGPVKRQRRLIGRTDSMIFDLIAQRRASDGEEAREDVLGMLLEARHEDGSEMSPREIRDELMTALVAGHETTASQLAFTCERLAREPDVRARLTAEIDSGDGEDYLTATINEILRLKPVLPGAAPRLVKRPVEIGGFRYPTGVALLATGYLLHRDPDIYPQPYAFRPERFLGRTPGTYEWIPFGGGRRRCLGASFALLEMKIVLRAALQRFEIAPGSSAPEAIWRRSITFSPALGATVVVSERARARPAEVADDPGHALAAST